MQKEQMEVGGKVGGRAIIFGLGAVVLDLAG